jgi:hypothetical protein
MSEQRAPMSAKRLFGTLIGFGFGATIFEWFEAASWGQYHPFVAFLAPACAFLGLAVLAGRPKPGYPLTIQNVEHRGLAYALCLLGLIAGGLNLALLGGSFGH